MLVRAQQNDDEHFFQLALLAEGDGLVLEEAGRERVTLNRCP